MHDPTATGGGVRHSTESMFTYHSGAFVGSPANAATSATERRITVSVSTSTSPATGHLPDASSRSAAHSASYTGTRSTCPTWILFGSRRRLAAAIFATVDPVARAMALTVSPRTTWCSW